MLGSQVLLSMPDGESAFGTDLIDAPGVGAVGVDLTDSDSVATLFREHGPFSGVIHCAAFTAVDKAEEEPELVQRVNADACGVLAKASCDAGIPMVMISTDFVFNGSASKPYLESDEVDPLSVYGKTKLDGERQALEFHPEGARIVRTQWLYGPRGKHFPRTIEALARDRDELKVVADQVGSPTSTLELSPALWDILRKGEAGIYHAACEGSCSWYEFACAIVVLCGIETVNVLPCSTEEFPRPAPRPAYSVLDCSKLTKLRQKSLSNWREALSTYLGSEDH
ncbi:MAG: dTDP-4-dehydrorhamnose reductase [Planctomycetota bacterium]|jgi:dTDP-4-dehydrorhamnose reductase